MKLDDLKKAEAKAQQGLQLAEAKAAELQRKAKAAKAMAEQARVKHKQTRKAAKQAKRLALAAEEYAGDQLRVWEKAQKCLAKALKKAAKAKAGQSKRPAPTSAARRNAKPAKPAAQKPPVVTPTTQTPGLAG